MTIRNREHCEMATAPEQPREDDETDRLREHHPDRQRHRARETENDLHRRQQEEETAMPRNSTTMERIPVTGSTSSSRTVIPDNSGLLVATCRFSDGGATCGVCMDMNECLGVARPRRAASGRLTGARIAPYLCLALGHCK